MPCAQNVRVFGKAAKIDSANVSCNLLPNPVNRAQFLDTGGKDRFERANRSSSDESASNHVRVSDRAMVRVLSSMAARVCSYDFAIRSFINCSLENDL